MNTKTQKNLFVFLLVAGLLPIPAPAAGPVPSPTPTLAVSKSGAPISKVSARPKALKNETESSIFRKPAVKKSPTLLKPLGLYDNPEFSASPLDYDKLNADLDPVLSNRPHHPTPDEKFWGTVGAVAGYSMAGVAAAQYLGILPNDQIKKKK